MGAFFAASLAAKREDIHKLVIIAGGCPVSEIVSRTWFFPLLKIRAWRKRHYAVTNEKDYSRRLERAVKTEPGKRLAPRPTRDDLMIVGSRDWIMPTRNQLRLAQQLRNPKIIKVSGGHFKTIVYANTFLVSRIVEHVEDGSMINLSTKTASAAPATISST